MAKPAYKFTEFVDLLVVALYEADQSDNAGEFHDLDTLARTIKGDVPRDWVFEAARVLMTRSLADCHFNSKGTFAKITGNGLLYVDEKRGITERARESHATYYVNIHGSGNQVVTGQDVAGVTQTMTQTAAPPAIRLLDEMASKVQADGTLSDDDKSEAKTYIQLLRFQVKKPEQDKMLVATLLEKLNKIASIAGNVASFIRLFNSWN